MFLLCQFGHFPITLEFPDNSLPTVLKPFEKFVQHCDQSLSAHISVRESPLQLPFECEPCKRWNTRFFENKVKTVYFDKQKPIFMLDYSKEDRCYEIQIGSVRSIEFRIALHYALLTALSDYCVGLHGVTVRVGDKHYILSAPSGTGKSTLAELLCRYCGAEIINGDYAFLSMDGSGKVLFEPTIFCGSSDIYQNKICSIDGLVFLQQAKQNRMIQLNLIQAYSAMIGNIFLFDYDEEMNKGAFEKALQISAAVPAYRYGFEPSEAAAHTFFKALN